jgi:Fe-S-cluster containining protein
MEMEITEPRRELPREPNESPDPLRFSRSPTPQLRAFVSQQRESLDKMQFENLIAEIQKVSERYTAKLLSVSPGIERALLLHQLMDRELQAASSQPVSCRKGCGGCCHYEVEVTEDEGALLSEVVLQGFAMDFDRLELQAKRERKSSEWNKYWSKKNRCVFLGDDGACQAYEYRPAICRKHLVVTPPEACTTPGATVSPVNVPLSEVLLSAALSIEGTSFASLSKMVVKTLAPQRN